MIAKKSTKSKAKKKTAPKAKRASAFNKALGLSPDLAKFVGAKSLSRAQVVKKLWAYIRSHKLQNPKNKRQIVPDARLAVILGKKPIDMFAMTKVLSKHFAKA